MRSLQPTTYHLQPQNGFIALISAIVISFLLLTLTVSAGFSGFFARFNLLDTEAKAKTESLAEACVDTAIVNIIQDPTYSPSNESVAVMATESCTIVSVSSVGVQKIIKTFAVVNKARTNLQAVFDTSTLRLSSKIECQNISSCE